MDTLPILSIIVLYFVVALIKPLIQPKLPFNLCSICAAVSLTWVSLLGVWLLGYSVSLVSMAVLMGMSVTGIMYKMEAFYQRYSIRNFWFIRLLVIVGGYEAVMLLLQENWFVLSFVVLFSFFLLILASLLFQGVTHKEALKGARGKKSLIQKLENCC